MTKQVLPSPTYSYFCATLRAHLPVASSLNSFSYQEVLERIPVAVRRSLFSILQACEDFVRNEQMLVLPLGSFVTWVDPNKAITKGLSIVTDVTNNEGDVKYGVGGCAWFSRSELLFVGFPTKESLMEAARINHVDDTEEIEDERAYNEEERVDDDGEDED